jgi:RNA polymerase sigma-70 factor, ECF subfamily
MAASVGEAADDALVAGFLSGQTESHRQVDRWIREVVASRGLRLGADADDVAQDVHRKLLTALRESRFEGRSSLRTYVWRVAQSTAIDHLRARSRRAASPLEAAPEPAATQASPEAALEQKERQQVLREVFASLGEDCRRLWALMIYEELPYAAIARRLGISEGNVKVRALRCREKARQQYRLRVTSAAPGRPSLETEGPP